MVNVLTSKSLSIKADVIDHTTKESCGFAIRINPDGKVRGGVDYQLISDGSFIPLVSTGKSSIDVGSGVSSHALIRADDVIPFFPLSENEVFNPLIRTDLGFTETMVDVGSCAMARIALRNPIIPSASSENLGPRLIVSFRVIPKGNGVFAECKNGIVTDYN